MATVVGIRFKNCGKVYDFDAQGALLRKGDCVVIESEFGISIGHVVDEPHEIENPPKQLKKILRIATDDDFMQRDENDAFEREARAFCIERIEARNLPMRLVCAEAALDRKRIVFYFTADHRVDFRELVKDLAARFRTRIELRQIGVRDKAKLVGGLGICGKELCCRAFLTEFAPISIKMAKKQDLSLNTGKLSGCCGRLMCCLGYEYQEQATGRRREKGKEREEEGEIVPPAEVPQPQPEIPEEPGPEEAEGEESEPAPEQEGTAAPATEEQRKRRRRRRRRHKKRPQPGE